MKEGYNEDIDFMDMLSLFACFNTAADRAKQPISSSTNAGSFISFEVKINK